MGDGGKVVLPFLILRETSGPQSRLGILPRMPRQERDLAGALPLANKVVEEEIVQFIGADDAFGRLDRAVLTSGHQLG